MHRLIDMMAPVLVGSLFTFAVAVAATRAVRGVALRRGHVDYPDERKRHERAVPRLGGVGIAAGVFVGLTIAVAGGAALATDVLPLLVGAGVLVALGLWDDLRGLSFKRRFAVQVAVAYGTVLAGWHLDLSNIPVLDQLTPVTQTLLALPVTMLWIVGLINAMNLLDGLDGLVAGVATIAFAALAVASPGDPLLLALCTAGAAATLGFLVFNAHPASIFMGDTGSTLLGFLLAAAGLRSALGAPTPGTLAVPLVVLALPVLDTATAFVRRIVDGASPFLPDADHIHHRVLERSHGSVRRAVRAIWAASAVFGLIGIAMSRANGSDLVQIVCVVVAFVFAYLVVRRLRYVRIRVVWRKMQRRRIHARRAYEAPAATPVPAPGGAAGVASADGTAGGGTSGDGASRHPPTVSLRP